jgi:surface protein
MGRFSPFLVSKRSPFFTLLVKTDNAGTSGSNQFTIPTSGSVTNYNYNVVTSEETFINQTGNCTLTWATAGTYQVKITGVLPLIFFSNTGDRLKILEVQQWGNVVFESFNRAFFGCANMDITATDAPVIDNTNGSFSTCFRSCPNLVNANGSLANWEVENFTSSSMSAMFTASTNFNVDISNWITNNVTNTNSMFFNTNFNKDISAWNVSNITNMGAKFFNASFFNQNLGSWSLRTAGVNCNSLFRNCGMSTANYTDSLVGMINNAVDNGNLPINVDFTRQDGQTFDRARSGGSNFANAGAARDFAINTLGWQITSDTVIN